VLAGEVLLGGVAVYELHGHAAECRELFERCETQLDTIDSELADQLRVSILYTGGMLDDFETVVRCSRKLCDSDLAACRAFGLGWWVMLCALDQPARADRYLAQAAKQIAVAHQQQPGLNTDIAHQWVQLATTFVLGLRGDFKAAVDACSEAPDTLTTHDHQGTLGISLEVQGALNQALSGEPGQALDRLAGLEAWAQPWMGNSSFIASEIMEIKAIVHLGLGDLPQAESQIKAHALDAATGRIARLSCDAVVALAALAEAEQDNQTAIGLLLSSGVPKWQEMSQVAAELARRLDVVEDHAAQRQAAIYDDSWTRGGTTGGENALNALRAEITRRNWN
jgi:hypothetical protein